MQKFKKHLIGILLISIAVIGIIASSSSDSAHGTADYLLPSDFNPNKSILLIEKSGTDSQEKEMEAYMSSNYPYKYEFVSWDDLSTDKYADEETTYRFVIRSKNAHTGTFDYRFYDRSHNQNYSNSGDESSSPVKPLEKLVRKVVKKNK